MKTKSKIALLFLKIIRFCVLLNSHCGKAPSELSATITGSIKVSAHLETTIVDSMMIILDDVSLGKQQNPYILTDIEAGTHKVAVAKDDPESEIDFSSSPKLVTVNANDTAKVTLALIKTAPNFTLKNLNNEDVTLEDYRGIVVFLVFYALT